MDPADHLRRKSCRLTGPRQAILKVLRKQPRPVTNKEIFCALPRGECDLATVYRSVNLLERMGIVKRFHFGSGAARYGLTRTGIGSHCHHLICTECENVVEIEDCFAREIEERVASRNGFKAVTHRLEFFGVCLACQ